ncbi:MAG: peptidase C1, partial [Pseudomonadota bacterium]|nr:peptidase C1 [Pseudomonadota bacterium]
RLLDTGAYGLSKEGLRNICREHVPKAMKSWKAKRVLLYAHGGLVSQDSAVQYVANTREFALKAQVYPIAFIWRSDVWSTIRNILQDAISRRKAEGMLDAAKDFMLDRLDDTLELLARQLGGKTLWDEMKENATRAASRATGAARMTADHLIAMKKAGEIDEIHLVGHSAGSILMAPLATHLHKNGVPVSSLSLWAPACTIELFNDAYRPLIESKAIEAFDLYTLDDQTERDDNCAHLYNKSLLYLVSGAFEKDPRIPLVNPDGTPLLGLARDATNEKLIAKSFWNSNVRRHILSPGALSQARHHGDFDNDEKTLLTTLKLVTGGNKAASAAPVQLNASPARMAQRRQTLEVAIRRA